MEEKGWTPESDPLRTSIPLSDNSFAKGLCAKRQAANGDDHCSCPSGKKKEEMLMKPSFVTALSLWVLPGLMAGAGFLGIALIVGALTRTVWAVPDGIAQAIGITAPPGYGFALWPVVVGVAVHLAFSIGLGVIFTAVVRRLRLHGWVLVAAAILFIGLETPITIWIILYRLLPATTFMFFLTALPFWGSFLGRCMYGLILGLLLALHPSTASQKPQQHIR
jgi:hypothetical protein